MAYWKADPKSLADNNKDNHGISAQKFHLLREFFMLGYSVLLSGARGGARGARQRSAVEKEAGRSGASPEYLSGLMFYLLFYSADVDVAWLQNPFDHLKRDSDVEGLSDGFDDRTAYGAQPLPRPAPLASEEEEETE